MSGEKKPGAHAPLNGPLRGFLRLLVELDSSRFALHRIRSALLLLGLLACFGLLGYILPAWLSRYF